METWIDRYVDGVIGGIVAGLILIYSSTEGLALAFWVFLFLFGGALILWIGKITRKGAKTNLLITLLVFILIAIDILFVIWVLNI